ncbi:unnamed protein product [Amoebophrya sp. A120]|nr:unnamed protein product [Amoebophrya sp. A120]|eukprot:GSA120T00015696001.1
MEVAKKQHPSAPSTLVCRSAELECHRCGEHVDPKIAVTCERCGDVYHPTCCFPSLVNFSETDLKTKLPHWTCEICPNTRRKCDLFCLHCTKKIPQGAPLKERQCAECKGNFHPACLDPYKHCKKCQFKKTKVLRLWCVEFAKRNGSNRYQMYVHGILSKTGGRIITRGIVSCQFKKNQPKTPKDAWHVRDSENQWYILDMCFPELVTHHRLHPRLADRLKQGGKMEEYFKQWWRVNPNDPDYSVVPPVKPRPWVDRRRQSVSLFKGQASFEDVSFAQQVWTSFASHKLFPYECTGSDHLITGAAGSFAPGIFCPDKSFFAEKNVQPGAQSTAASSAPVQKQNQASSSSQAPVLRQYCLFSAGIELGSRFKVQWNNQEKVLLEITSLNRERKLGKSVRFWYRTNRSPAPSASSSSSTQMTSILSAALADDSETERSTRCADCTSSSCSSSEAGEGAACGSSSISPLISGKLWNSVDEFIVKGAGAAAQTASSEEATSARFVLNSALWVKVLQIKTEQMTSSSTSSGKIQINSSSSSNKLYPAPSRDVLFPLNLDTWTMLSNQRRIKMLDQTKRTFVWTKELDELLLKLTLPELVVKPSFSWKQVCNEVLQRESEAMEEKAGDTDFDFTATALLEEAEVIHRQSELMKALDQQRNRNTKEQLQQQQKNSKRKQEEEIMSLEARKVEKMGDCVAKQRKVELLMRQDQRSRKRFFDPFKTILEDKELSNGSSSVFIPKTDGVAFGKRNRSKMIQAANHAAGGSASSSSGSNYGAMTRNLQEVDGSNSANSFHTANSFSCGGGPRGHHLLHGAGAHHDNNHGSASSSSSSRGGMNTVPASSSSVNPTPTLAPQEDVVMEDVEGEDVRRPIEAKRNGEGDDDLHERRGLQAADGDKDDGVGLQLDDLGRIRLNSRERINSQGVISTSSICYFDEETNREAPDSGGKPRKLISSSLKSLKRSSRKKEELLFLAREKNDSPPSKAKADGSDRENHNDKAAPRTPPSKRISATRRKKQQAPHDPAGKNTAQEEEDPEMLRLIQAELDGPRPVETLAKESMTPPLVSDVLDKQLARFNEFNFQEDTGSDSETSNKQSDEDLGWNSPNAERRHEMNAKWKHEYLKNEAKNKKVTLKRERQEKAERERRKARREAEMKDVPDAREYYKKLARDQRKRRKLENRLLDNDGADEHHHITAAALAAVSDDEDEDEAEEGGQDADDFEDVFAFLDGTDENGQKLEDW